MHYRGEVRVLVKCIQVILLLPGQIKFYSNNKIPKNFVVNQLI